MGKCVGCGKGVVYCPCGRVLMSHGKSVKKMINYKIQCNCGKQWDMNYIAQLIRTNRIIRLEE